MSLSVVEVGVQIGEFEPVFKVSCYHVKVQNHLIPLPIKYPILEMSSFFDIFDLSWPVKACHHVCAIQEAFFPDYRLFVLTLPSLNLYVDSVETLYCLCGPYLK